MYKRICSLFSVGNDAQKGDISWRLNTLTLRENATSQEMQAHFDAFSTLLSEGKSTGLDVADWDRREKFLLSLPRDLQTILRTSLRGRSTQTWAELCSLFNEEIDIRSRQELRDAQINAAVKMEKGGRRQQDNGEKGGKGGKKHKKKKGGEVKKCGWCGIKGHEEKECRKKAAGDPSQAEIRQAIQHIRQQKSSQGQSDSARFIDATAWGSAPTLFDNNANKQDDVHLWATITLVNDSANASPYFMLDTRASHHITNIRSALVNLRPAEVINFGLAGTMHQFSSYEEGDLRVPVEDGIILIKGIRYSPGANHSILSASCLRAANWHIELEKDYLSLGPHKFTLSWDNRHNFPATD